MTSDVDVRAARLASELAQARYEAAVKANQILAGAVPRLEVLQLRLSAKHAAFKVQQPNNNWSSMDFPRNSGRSNKSVNCL